MSDDPSVFLRPAPDRSMQDQTRMFDSKKWVWIAHDEEAFVAAQVKGQKGDMLTIETPDGQVSARVLRASVCSCIACIRQANG